MDINSFFAHYNISENPFAAEEAGLDPVFSRLLGHSPMHPDFQKILGPLDKPSTAIVFGEKGSGKTAIRLQLEKYIEKHNTEKPSERILTVTYDDLNPMLDNLMRSRKQNAKAVLKHFRLEDHQDAILSVAITKLVSAILDQHAPVSADQPSDKQRSKRQLRKTLTRQQRVDLAVLAALYDQPVTGSVTDRWDRLSNILRVKRFFPVKFYFALAIILLIASGGLYAAEHFIEEPQWWLLPSVGVALAGTIGLLGWISWSFLSRLKLAWTIQKDTPAITRTRSELRQMLTLVSGSDLQRQPFPTPPKDEESPLDSRYQLTRRFIEILHQLDYAGMIILLDRLDEPTLVSGDPARMQAILRPMLDNKFLQQHGIGVKLLLPLELHYSIRRESPEFFQRARLDKQSMIDRLRWSGSTLYDLCNTRLRMCETPEGDTPDQNSASLKELFTPDVSREAIIDALEQMHQPRDAFKFLYDVIQEHCRMVSDEDENYSIAKITLDTVRRDHVQRIQDFSRGLGPG
ncbi:MnhB domain-containing protein [Planctomycetota bacterium]|nr:MnhB domain-containing protein [Planctomycetota bacterium]